MTEKTLSSRRVFSGRLLTLDVEEVALEDGVVTSREIVGHPGAAAVLAQDEDDLFVLVKQYRKPVEAEMLEIVAGVLRPGECPEECARRELVEETGMVAVSLSKLGVVYPSPGYTREALHIFFARVSSSEKSANPDEDERIEVVRMGREQMERAIRTGVIRDAKTLAAWALHLVVSDGRNAGGRS